MDNKTVEPPLNLAVRIATGALLVSAVTIALVLPAVVEPNPTNINKTSAGIVQSISLVALLCGLGVRRLLLHFCDSRRQFLINVFSFAIWESAVILSTVRLLIGGTAWVSYAVSGITLGLMLIYWRLIGDA